MRANSKLFVIITSMIFLGSIGLSEDAFAVTLSGAAGCTSLGGTWNGGTSTCVVDNSITVTTGLTVTNGITLEVGDGAGAVNSAVITLTGTQFSQVFNNNNGGTIHIKSDGRIVSTIPGTDFNNFNGGMVTIEGSIEVTREYDNLAGATTVHECSGIITVPAGQDFDNDGTYTQRGLLNGATGSSNPALDNSGTYIDDSASCGASTADLSIAKTDSTDPVIAGNQLTYTVTVTNNDATNTATNVVVTDTLPAGVTLVSTTGCAEDPNGVAACSLGSILPSTSVQYTITVTVDVDVAHGTVLNNLASVASDNDPNGANDSTSELTTVIAEADLAITKTDSADPVLTSTGFSYTVTVTNNGPSDAQGVVVTDTLPAGVTLVSTTGCIEDPNGTPTCTLGTIAAGGNTAYTISVTSPATAGLITNTASVASSTTLINTGDDSVMETTQITTVGLDYGDAPDTGAGTGTGNYNTLLADNGPSHVIGGAFLGAGLPDSETDGQPTTNADGDDTNGVDDEDMGFLSSISPGVPTSFPLVFSHTTPGTNTFITGWIDYNQNGIFENNVERIVCCNTPGVPFNNPAFPLNPPTSGIIPGDTYVRFRVSDDSFITNNAVGPSPDGEVEDYMVHITGADLSITKMINDMSPNVGDTVTFTVTINNAGPDAATGVVLTDTLDAGLAFNSETSNTNGAFDGTTWTLANPIASGVTETLVFTADVNSLAPMFNFAEITSSTLFDVDSTPGNGASPTPVEDDEAVVALNVQMADLEIEKIVDNANPSIGDTVTYTVTVTNNDVTYDADNVEVTDTLPAGVTLVSTSGCAEDPNGVPICSLGTITASNSVQYTIEVEIDTSGELINTVEITGADQFDPDSSNNIAEVSVIVPGSGSDNSVSYQDPNLGDVRHGNGHDRGFCMDQNCVDVDGYFTHFPETTVSQGSTHSFTLLINCPRGANTCNHVSIGGALPDSTFYDTQWEVTLDRIVGTDEWDLTVSNPFDEIGDVTATVQQVDNSFITVTANVPFLIPGSIGTPDGIGSPQENNRHLHVTLWDNNRGVSNYIFNEGMYVEDIYAYPQVETSFDAPLVYDKLCINEDEKDRKTCAFELVKQWTIQQAEEKLKELYDQKGQDMDSYDESEQN